MRGKLGLFNENDKDKSLILDLLTWMHQKKLDYTNTFCHLMNDEIKKDIKFEDENFQNWKIRWKERLRENSDNYQNSQNDEGSENIENSETIPVI